MTNNSSFKKKLENIFILILIVILTLFLSLVYKAYVINQPCKHDIGKPNESNRIKVTKNQIKKLQEALRFQTVTHNHHSQNNEALAEYGKFIREEFKDLESLKL